ncbi:hypothetical protein ACQJBY_023226 [Aegilops geniculata]
MATRKGPGSGRKVGRPREWVSSGKRRRRSEVEAREDARTAGVRREGREAMAAETASGDGDWLGARWLRRKRCGVRREEVAKGRRWEREAPAGVLQRMRRRSVLIAAAAGILQHQYSPESPQKATDGTTQSPTRFGNRHSPSTTRSHHITERSKHRRPTRLAERMAAAVALASPLRRLLHSPCQRRAIPTPLHFLTRGRCDVALAVSAAAVGDSSAKGSVHRHVIEEVMDILDMAQRASQRRDVFHTSFLTPPIITEAMLAIEKLADIKAVAQGGYPQAERCRISVGHPDSMRSDPDHLREFPIGTLFSW